MTSQVYPMTLEQESMWLDDRLSGGPSQYLESWVLELTGDVDRDAVRWAFAQLVARHEALRSRFVMDGGQLLQIVLPEHETPQLAQRTCSPGSVDAQLRELVRQPMDLTAGAVRAILLEVAPDRVILAVQLHHIVVDDWSLRTLDREFAEHYRARVEHRPPTSAPPPMQPGQYAVSQRSARPDPAVLAYWRENLRDLPADTAKTIPSDRAPSPGPDRGARVDFSLDAASVRSLRAACRQLRTTPFAVFAATTALLLGSANGARHAIVGTPVSSRGTADRDRMVAPLIRLLPLRLRVDPEQSYAELVAQTKASVFGAIAHQDVSYADLVKLTRARGNPETLQLCRTVLVVDDAGDARIELPGAAARRVYVESGSCKFDLCFTLVLEAGQYSGFLDYSAGLFSDTTARRLVTTFQTLLAASVGDVRRSLSALTAAPSPSA